MRRLIRRLLLPAAALVPALAPAQAPVPAAAQPPAAPVAAPLYMPRAVRQAYAKGTRSPDGRPGARYWQNRARYAIALTVAPPDRTVRGREQITYANNSPDTLRAVVIKLFLNIHKPGVPYPYEKTTIVQGSADMEYPMMVNDGSTGDTTFSRFVAEHELAHTWFPFYMGINETRYGFMDEGWATTFEYLINQADMGPARAAAFFKQFRVASWIADPSPLADLPIVTPGDALSGRALGNNEYGKAALGYLALKDLLGDAGFRAALHGFMDRWHGRHPIPWDFFHTVNDVSGRNLNWFWQAWFFDRSTIDLGVAAVRPTGGGYTVTLDNVGGMPAPVDLVLRYADGTAETVHETPAIWAADPRRAAVTLRTPKRLQSLALDGGIWMDANPANDRWAAP